MDESCLARLVGLHLPRGAHLVPWVVNIPRLLDGLIVFGVPVSACLQGEPRQV